MTRPPCALIPVSALRWTTARKPGQRCVRSLRFRAWITCPTFAGRSAWAARWSGTTASPLRPPGRIMLDIDDTLLRRCLATSSCACSMRSTTSSTSSRSSSSTAISMPPHPVRHAAAASRQVGRNHRREEGPDHYHTAGIVSASWTSPPALRCAHPTENSLTQAPRHHRYPGWYEKAVQGRHFG